MCLCVCTCLRQRLFTSEPCNQRSTLSTQQILSGYLWRPCQASRWEGCSVNGVCPCLLIHATHVCNNILYVRVKQVLLERDQHDILGPQSNKHLLLSGEIKQGFVDIWYGPWEDDVGWRGDGKDMWSCGKKSMNEDIGEHLFGKWCPEK